MLIAIDGPAGAGKSTVARAVARELGFTYLDSGAMYRCVALAVLQRPDADLLDHPDALAALAREIQIGLGDGVFVDDEDVSDAIRSSEVSEMASRVAAEPGVRDALVSKQRELIGRGDWVAEGRDIGTVVAPGAEIKIFLSASAEERARRRAGELGADPQRVLAEQTLRDERDSSRQHSPLVAARDALMLDTTGLSVELVVKRIAALARAAAAGT